LGIFSEFYDTKIDQIAFRNRNQAKNHSETSLFVGVNIVLENLIINQHVLIDNGLKIANSVVKLYHSGGYRYNKGQLGKLNGRKFRNFGRKYRQFG
jgi:hypothetical protein